MADAVDRAEHLPVAPGEPERPGFAATAWAVAKAAGVMATSPVSLPGLAVAARRTAQDSIVRVERFDEHVLALAEGRPTPLPAPKVTRLDGRQRWLITSDLHRGVPGRLDWPRRQGTKELYARMLEHYAADGWGLVENGDVEDFWMVGGSTWGAVYDIARLAGGLVSAVDDTVRIEVLADQLDRMVDNNARTYRTISEGFLQAGRYHRTLGNHDEALAAPELRRKLGEHLPGVEPVDTVLLVDPGLGRAPEEVRDLADVMAFVTHGHLTDSWNGPGYSPLGRAITWLGLGLEDLPTLGGSGAAGTTVGGAEGMHDTTGPPDTTGLPDEQAVGPLLAGRGRNRLITVDPRFGGNRRFDSLDEERLFAALDGAAPDGEWPWMLFGHTHYPMLQPVDAQGRVTRYANSGTGVLDHAVSALEWDPDGGDQPVRLVLWHLEEGVLRRHELVPDGARLAVR